MGVWRCLCGFPGCARRAKPWEETVSSVHASVTLNRCALHTVWEIFIRYLLRAFPCLKAFLGLSSASSSSFQLHPCSLSHISEGVPALCMCVLWLITRPSHMLVPASETPACLPSLGPAWLTPIHLSRALLRRLPGAPQARPPTALAAHRTVISLVQ